MPKFYKISVIAGGVVLSLFSSFGSLQAAPPITSPRLSSLLNDRKLTGLTFESHEENMLLHAQVKDFIKFRLGKLSPEGIQDLMNVCGSSQTDGNPFCPLILSPEKLQHTKDISFISKRRRYQFISKLVSSITAGRVDDLKEATPADLRDAFRRISGVKPLHALILNALTDESCPSSALTMNLGLRVESEFPESEYKGLATLLYERGAECGTDIYALQARYRLGLMKIWEGNCLEAEAALSKVADSKEELSYRLRIGYWRYFCAVELKNEALKVSLQNWLLREYPLSLHGLLANSEAPIQALTSGADQDPEVAVRSVKNLEINRTTRAIEALLAEDQSKLASRVLVAFSESVQQTCEESFQLYWAVLLERAGERASGFELMARLFRGNPRLLSKVALALMYPLQQLSWIGDTATYADPLLVLSVIRQESAFNENAKSSGGALGLMQVQLRTARNFENVSKQQLYKPRINIRVGAKYLNRLMKVFGGDVELALAAYNAGPTRIREWMKRYPIKNRLLFLDLLPIRETRDYVSSIARNYYWYSTLYGKVLGDTTGRKVVVQGPELLKVK